MKYLSTVLTLLLFTLVFSLPAKAVDVQCGGPEQPACEVPEPGSLGILALGLVALVASRIKRK